MIKVANKYIGEGQPCFIAAELGINHNADMDIAKKSIKAAKDAGADAVKFQNYCTDDFILNKELTYQYISQGKTVIASQYEMFKRYELRTEQLVELKKYCDELGIIFFSTPTGLKGINDLLKLNTPLLKNGSDFLVNLELIAQMAQSKIPTIISTGMATLSEIDEAVRTFEEAGGDELIILHCTSSYPTPVKDINLKKIPALIQAFEYPIGFSDHSEGIVAAVGAVVLGACFIEKHFTLDKNLAGPDHRFSSDPKELKELIDAVRFIERSLGTSKLKPTKQENFGRENFRLSCVSNKNLPKGHILTRNDIAFSRPAKGLAPKFVNILVGKTTTKSLIKSEIITFTNTK